MAGLRGVDHVVIRVERLDRAMADYAALGFTVTAGGAHPAFGTHNAVIPFQDGSYLELIARDPAADTGQGAVLPGAAGGRVAGWLDAPEGLVDWALLPADTAAAAGAARDRGLTLTVVEQGQRRRPDGETVAWTFCFPERYDLPFLCGDVTPRRRRVPDGAARRHANGAKGISAITLRSTDPAATRAAFARLLGLPASSRLLQVGSTTIRVTGAPGREGPIALELRGRGGPPARPLDPTLTHGAALSILD